VLQVHQLVEVKHNSGKVSILDTGWFIRTSADNTHFPLYSRCGLHPPHLSGSGHRI